MSSGAHNLRFVDAVDRTGLYTVVAVTIRHYSSTMASVTGQLGVTGTPIAWATYSPDLHLTHNALNILLRYLHEFFLSLPLLEKTHAS